MRKEALVEVAGEQLRLLPERAVYWPRQKTLFIADPHFGKAAAFRAAAIPVPAGTTDENLGRLDAALEATAAQRLVCLGDLLHTRSGRTEQTMTALAEWRAAHQTLDFCLVRGNHDRHAGDPPPEWQVQVLEEPVQAAPFVWRHFPEVDENGYVLAGHLHPAIRLGRGRLGETLRCFYFGESYAVLPAFGDFTGSATLPRRNGARVFVMADEQVLPVPPR
jgi:DNA ligase-associated metallophosphoesterase